MRSDDLCIFLRLPRNRDCLRVLRKLAAWFLRQYDVHHAAVMIYQAEAVARGDTQRSRVLSRHRTRNYVALLAGLLAPFAGAALAYERAPRLFDALCAGELLLVGGLTESGPTADVWRGEVSGDRFIWSEMSAASNVIPARSSHDMTWIESDWFVFGGLGTGGALADLWRLASNR